MDCDTQETEATRKMKALKDTEGLSENNFVYKENGEWYIGTKARKMQKPNYDGEYRVFENERIFKDNKEYYYDFHEVYYDDKGNIVAWTEEPITPYIEYFKDIDNYQDKFILAITKKIVKFDKVSETVVELDKYLRNIE